MSDPTGPRPSRQERAARTRQAILDAALETFNERGFDGATMQEVADRAGVAVQTVYLGFRTKKDLLAAVEALVALGGTANARMTDEPWVAELRAETDPLLLVQRFVAVDVAVLHRLAVFVAGTRRALDLDPASVARRDAERDAFLRMLTDRLAELGALRPGLSAPRALDILRAVNTVEGFMELTQRRGWSPDEYASWFESLLRQQLLAPSGER